MECNKCHSSNSEATLDIRILVRVNVEVDIFFKVTSIGNSQIKKKCILLERGRLQ